LNQIGFFDSNPALEYEGSYQQLNKIIEVTPEELKTKEFDIPAIPSFLG
jgi:hypothetical protein